MSTQATVFFFRTNRYGAKACLKDRIQKSFRVHSRLVPGTRVPACMYHGMVPGMFEYYDTAMIANTESVPLPGIEKP